MKGGDGMRIGFIGAGKVGCTLGKYFRENGIPVSGYYNRTSEHAKEAAEFTDTLYYEDVNDLINESDMIFITVSDNSIPMVYGSLDKKILAGKIIAHSSGALSSSVFTDSGTYGFYGYSIHPIYAVNDRFTAYKNFQNAFITIEGNEDKIDFLLNLFLAVIPRYLLALSGLPAMVVSAIYMISITTIYKRDFKLEDAGIKSLWTKTRAEEEKKKQEEVEKLFNSAMAGLVILVILWGICIFTEMRLDSALSSLIMIIAAIVMGVSVRSGHRHWNQKRLVNDSYVLLAAIILSRLLLLANPHYDIYYYGGTVFLFAFILYTLIQLIREYNLMTTRPLPQLDRQGGDTSAPV